MGLPPENIPAWLFGIPLSPVTNETAESQIMEWGKDAGNCKFVATSNVDFLVKALTWFASPPRHPELVDVLRGAAMNTADGMPLVWAARWLGGSVPARVSGSDLVPALAANAASSGLSIFLLGGREEVTALAAEKLVQAHPGLKIAGVDTPFVKTEGGEIAFEENKDREICQRINSSGAGILLIGFGNPKQEMWFQRNSYRLQTGVALGVGGTFNFIAGNISRAPEWMQKSGLEWVFRFLEEPGRLWKRYALGLTKFAFIAGPVCLGHKVIAAVASSKAPARFFPPFFSGADMVSLVRLPSRLSGETVDKLASQLAPFEDQALVLDASACQFIDARGLGLLWSLWRTAREHGRYLYAPCGRFRTLVRIHRASDFLSSYTCDTLPSLIARLHERFSEAGCFVSIDGQGRKAAVTFLGGLTVQDLHLVDRKGLVEGLAGQDISINLSYCPRLDSDGLALLVQILHVARDAGFRAKIDGISQEVQRGMEVAGLKLT